MNMFNKSPSAHPMIKWLRRTFLIQYVREYCAAEHQHPHYRDMFTVNIWLSLVGLIRIIRAWTLGCVDFDGTYFRRV